MNKYLQKRQSLDLLHSIKNNRRALNELWKKKENRYALRKQEDKREAKQEAQYLDNIFHCLDELHLLNNKIRKSDKS